MTVEVYIATSVDGYIADAAGDFRWLDAFDDVDYDYDAFYAGVDALVMGRTTYEDVRAMGEWMYAGKPCLVMSRGAAPDTLPDGVQMVPDVPAALAALRRLGARHVWHVGGGKSIAAFLETGVVDVWRIFVIPILLGSGIRLFPEHGGAGFLKLVECRAYENGVAELRYETLPGTDGR